MHGWGIWQIARIGFAIFLVVVCPFLDLPAVRRLRANTTSAGRLKFYRTGVASLIVMGLFGWWLMVHTGGQWLTLPATHTGIFGLVWFRAGLAVIMVAFFSLALLPGVATLTNARKRAAYTKAVAKSGLEFMMPRGSLERKWWFGLSVAAGIFEEVIFRGFLLQFARLELGLGLLLALLLVSVVFGWNHLYQGTSGIVKSGVTGLAMGIVAVLSGGLLLPMLLHAAIDVQILLMYRPEESETSGAGGETATS